MTKLEWENVGHREYKPGVDHGTLYIKPEVWHGLPGKDVDVAPIEGVVVEQSCRETWEWDEFYAACELNIDGHTKHRWTHHDTYKGVDVVIEWESFWADELPDTSWMCPDCNHLHKGKAENAENPRYWMNGSCKQDVPRWNGGKAKCACERRRPDKEKA